MTFGPQTDVPLAARRQLVPQPVRHRGPVDRHAPCSTTGPPAGIYFTKDGSSRLYHRSFSPESRVVGGERFSSDTDAGGVSWDNVETMFLAGGQLYTSSSNGNLTRRTWNPATGLPVGARRPRSAARRSTARTGGPGTRSSTPTEVSRPPNVAPTASFTSSCVGGDCPFNSSASSDTDGTIVGRAWDWGDSTPPGTGITPSHTYADLGTYTVTLTVTDDGGATTPRPDRSRCRSRTSRRPPTSPRRVPGSPAPSTAPARRTPTAPSQSSTGPSATAPGHRPTAEHTYAAAGTYTVTLTVTDDDGATNTKTAGMSVIDPNADPTVEFRAAGGTNVEHHHRPRDRPGIGQPG